MRALTDIRYSDAAESCLPDIFLPQADEFDVPVYFHGGWSRPKCF